MRNHLLLACILFLAIPPLSAQPRAGSETINVVLVEVPVTVVDRDGNPIRGLTKDNFELFDAGDKRDVTHFEVVDFGSLPADPQEISAPARRNFLLLFDLTHCTPMSLDRARAAARSFVLQQVSPYDRIGVATTNVRGGFRLLTSFTTDRAIASLAVDTLGAPKYYRPKDPLLLTVTELESAVAAGRFDNAEDLKQLGLMLRRSVNDVERNDIQRHLNQIGDLGRLLDRVAGRKQVVLLSEGFDARMLAGRESLSSEEQKIEQRLIETGRGFMVDTDNRYGNTYAANTLRSMIDALRRSDVVLHAIDIKGLRSEVDASDGAQRLSNESLSLMTSETGGTVFKNANDLSSEFGRMLKAQEVTYILGFQVPSRIAGKFHDLRVKLSNVPGGRATYRTGYYEPSPATTAVDRTLTAAEIIMNRIPVEEVKVRALAAPAPRGDGMSEVPVVVDIDGKSLIEDVKDNEAAAEIFMYAFDPKEIIRDFVYQRISFDLSKLRTKLSTRGVKFYNTLRLHPGDYSIRILVRSATGRNGFQNVAVHVPGARERVIMAPLLFDDTRDWVMVKAPDRKGAAEYPFMAGQEPFVPAAVPVLTPGQSYNVALVTYNVPMDLNVKATIEGGGATVIPTMSLLGRTNPTPEGRVTTVLEMKSPNLERGPYSLVFLVKEQGSGTENRVTAPFVVP